jgi:hypothetical protein
VTSKHAVKPGEASKTRNSGFEPGSLMASMSAEERKQCLKWLKEKESENRQKEHQLKAAYLWEL